MDTLALLAEFFGTFLLVLTVIATGGNAYWIGAALAVIVLLIGKISGAHVNPAISVTMFVKGALSSTELATYIVAQCLGAVASLYTYRVFA